jgi:transposase-like protein
MTCPKCRVQMQQENHAHLFHGNRKWRCPTCNKVRMQKPRQPKRAKDHDRD